MLDFSSAIIDADIILYVTDVVEEYREERRLYRESEAKAGPILLVLNKIDLTTPDKLDALFDKWKEIIHARNIPDIGYREFQRGQSIQENSGVVTRGRTLFRQRRNDRYAGTLFRNRNYPGKRFY